MNPEKKYNIRFRILKIKIKLLRIKLKKNYIKFKSKIVSYFKNKNIDNVDKVEEQIVEATLSLDENQEINSNDILENKEDAVQDTDTKIDNLDITENKLVVKASDIKLDKEKDEEEKYSEILYDTIKKEEESKSEYRLEKYKNLVEKIKKINESTIIEKKDRKVRKESNIKKYIGGIFGLLAKKLKPDFSNLKSKLKYTLITLFILVIIGFGTFFIQAYFNTPERLTKKYLEELNAINIDKNIVISIIKEDVNSDNIPDYICLTGSHNGVYNNENSKVYDKFGVSIINGNTKEIKEYLTDKSIGSDYKFYIKANNNKKYIFVSSDNTCNVSLLTMVDNNIEDVLKNSFNGMPSGYSISYTKNDEAKSLDVNINNNGLQYLASKGDAFKIDLSNTNFDLNNYRKTYLKEKFSTFDLVDIDNDGNIEFVAIQNILYLNVTSEELPKTYGKIKVIFAIDNNKMTFKDVKVEN